MASLIVGGSTISIAPGGIRRDRLDMTDRSRAFDGTYRASVTGNPKRDFFFSTPPLARATADFYEWLFGSAITQPCSGDIIGGSQNLALQSENFGTTWTLSGTPVRTPAFLTVAGVTMDLIGDDSAAAVEGYEQVIGFTGNAVKAVSCFVNGSGSTTSSVLRLQDTTAPATRLFATLTWSGGLPVIAMTAGTDLGSDVLTGGVFRLKFQTTSVTATNSNQFSIFPATTAAFAVANTGNLCVGGVQAEDALIPSAYVETTTAVVSTLTINCCPEITDWVPVRTADGHRVVLSFVLHEQ